MQILADTALFTPARIENGLLELLTLCPVDSGCDDVTHSVVAAGKSRSRPTNEATGTIPRVPIGLELSYRAPGFQLFKYRTQPPA